MKLVDLHPITLTNKKGKARIQNSVIEIPPEKTVPTDGIWRGERFHRPGLGLI